jgi:hypothetical protein
VWGNKYISFGGRVVLLNAVLNAIPVFYLSYLKIPVQVWKKIRRLQREFLWGGRRGRKKISWIKWDTVCLPKKEGGLGVRDIRAVNISLLSKWRWRLLDNNQVVWKDVITSKYGANVVGRVDLGDESRPWYASLWWKDVCSIGVNCGINWFSQCAVKKLGNGSLTSFWRDKWIGDTPLKDRFLRLFTISNQKEASVADVWNMGNEVERWRFHWRRRFFVWEETMLGELKELLNGVLISEEVDSWSWQPESDKVFTVKSAYDVVAKLSVSTTENVQWHAKVFQSLWKSPTPSKVCSFVWQLLHDRIPTKQNLIIRHVIVAGNDSLCPMCGLETETAEHLFLYCSFATKVWVEIFLWFNTPFSLPHNRFSIFSCFSCVGDQRTYKGRMMICCAVVWKIWKLRNSILFENITSSIADLVEGVKVISWKWWLARTKQSHRLFYEWRAAPDLCLL